MHPPSNVNHDPKSAAWRVR